MANFRTATIAAALFCLFSISLSRSPPQTNDEATTIAFTELDPALRLPTEADAKANTETDSNSAAVPLTDITFRPVNRRFRVRSKQPCRHHFKFYPAMRENKPIPYGNDMIQLSGENSDFEEPIVRGGGKRIPGRWMRTHHRHRHNQLSRRIDDDTDTDTDTDTDSDDEQNVDRVKRVVLKRFNYDRIDREKKMKKLREHFRARIAAAEEEEKKPKKGSFMKGVRKFLDRYV